MLSNLVDIGKVVVKITNNIDYEKQKKYMKIKKAILICYTLLEQLNVLMQR